ncbi:MAG: YaiI/YqxD family protein [Acidobacteriia bacterium]|nr:YaiI/YqxD family protein [Terriglobia bacterium]
MLDIYVDGDGCPVKDEVYRVAERYGLRVLVVSHVPIRVPSRSRVEPVRVKRGFGAADDWIAEHILEEDIAVTADIPLADRCLKRGARVVAPNGHFFTEASIGDALASRELMEHLRQMGEVTGGPAPFVPADRSRFLSRLDEAVVAVRLGKAVRR